MRDTLPKKIHRQESGILNMDTNIGEGTHWVAYTNENKKITYFDSYGNLPPPIELIKYFYSNGDVTIHYNYEKIQSDNSYMCGQYALNFLYNQYL